MAPTDASCATARWASLPVHFGAAGGGVVEDLSSQELAKGACGVQLSVYVAWRWCWASRWEAFRMDEEAVAQF